MTGPSKLASASPPILWSASEQGQASFNKQRQVAALDWLLLNAPETSVPVDYRNDTIKAGS
jgi:hypothetical protein